MGFLCITRPLAQQPGWNLVPAPHLPCTSAITQSLLWAKRTLTLVPTKLCYSNCCNEEPEAKVQPALAGHSPPWALPSKPSFLVLREDASKWQLPFQVAFSATSCPVQGPAVTDKGGRATSRPPSQSSEPLPGGTGFFSLMNGLWVKFGHRQPEFMSTPKMRTGNKTRWLLHHG